MCFIFIQEKKMDNTKTWIGIITVLSIIVFLFGIFYYGILDFVVNPAAFIISLIIIILILVSVIVYSKRK